jgi:hypothetical protein
MRYELSVTGWITSTELDPSAPGGFHAFSRTEQATSASEVRAIDAEVSSAVGARQVEGALAFWGHDAERELGCSTEGSCGGGNTWG